MAVPIVFAIDDAYLDPLMVALVSLRAANPWLADGDGIVVLHENLSDLAKDQIMRCADLLGLAADIRRARLPDLDYNTALGGARANYLRLAIPDTITGADRVLYLDADIVVTGDIRPLAGADLAGLPIGAVRDAINPTLGTGKALPGWRELGLDADREYFNSGVMVIDLLAAAADGLFERAFAAVTAHGPRLRLWIRTP